MSLKMIGLQEIWLGLVILTSLGNARLPMRLSKQVLSACILMSATRNFRCLCLKKSAERRSK